MSFEHKGILYWYLTSSVGLVSNHFENTGLMGNKFYFTRLNSCRQGSKYNLTLEVLQKNDMSININLILSGFKSSLSKTNRLFGIKPLWLLTSRSLDVDAAKAECAAGCNKRIKCKFADLYWFDNWQTCYLRSEKCGILYPQPVYHVYQSSSFDDYRHQSLMS